MRLIFFSPRLETMIDLSGFHVERGKITGAGRGGSLLALVTESTSAAVEAAWGESALAYVT